MPQYARIEEGAIVELATFDSITGRFPATLTWVNVTGIGGAAIGKYYDLETGTISDPDPSAPAHVTLTKLEFRRLFTLSERAGIDDYVASSTLTDAQKAMTRTLQYDLSIASEVALDDPLTVAGVQMLEQFGLIAAGRAVQILTNTAPSGA
jgi:hypothetical protein